MHKNRYPRPGRARRLTALGVSLAVSVSVIQGAELALASHAAVAATFAAPSAPSVTGLSPWSLNSRNQVGYTTSTQPTLRAVATADAGTYRAEFELTPDPAFADTTYTFTGQSGLTASGSTAVLTVPQANALPNGKHLRLRVRAYDGTTYGPWGGYVAHTVDATLPAAPTVTCAGVPANGWVASLPTGTQCTLSAAVADGQGYAWGLDDSSTSGRAYDTAFASGKSLDVTITPGAGWHTLYARTIDAAGNQSTNATAYSFGIGTDGAALLTPLGGERAARRLTLSAKGSTGYTGVSYEYRIGETDTWKDVPAANTVKAADGSAVSWPVAVSGGDSAALVWNVTDTLAKDGPVDVRAKFTKTGATGYSAPSTVTVDRSAGLAPTQEIGPGTLNALTGDFDISATDVSLFGLGVTRSASSRQPDAGTTGAGQAAVFGPQWSSGLTAELTGTDWVAVQQTSGSSVAVVTEDGKHIGFTATSGGGWQTEPGSGELTLTGSLTGTFTLKDTDGRTVTFAKVDAAAADWSFASSYLATANSTTTLVSEKVVAGGKTLARPKYLVAPTSAATAATCAATPATKGCRVLEYTYAGATTATANAFGDYAGQVQQIKLWATAPGAAASTATPVASYAYDNAGRLREEWDPRLSTPLKTGYGYDSAGRVTTVTPPGELPWTMTYGKAGSSAVAGDGMLLKAARPTLAQGSANQTDGGEAATSVVYNVPLSGSKAPYQLGSADVAAWHQSDVPSDATALFPADQVPASNDGAALTATGYQRATVLYADAAGRPVNVAAPGGHITTTQYDRFGNTVRSLSPANRAVALGLTAADQAVQQDLGIAVLSSSDRAELLENYSYFSDNGLRELEVFGPLHRVDLTSDFKSGSTLLAPAGSSVTARSWAVKEYDTGRPTDGTAVASNLLTITTAGLRVNGYDSILADKRVTEDQYDWTKGLVKLHTEDSGGLGITTGTGYDAQGRVVSRTEPGSTADDAGALVTVYWKADSTGWCKGRPEWADLVCWTGPAGAITGGGSNPTSLPDNSYEYGLFGQVTSKVDTSGNSSRVTTTTYDAAGRPVKTALTGSNNGQAVSDVTTAYSATTGRVTSTSSSTGGTITHGYDTLGRAISYTDADGGTTAVAYDKLDRPVTLTDNVPSTSTYRYDSAAEPRGLPVQLDDSVAGTFKAVYNPDGVVASEQLPGGYTLKQTVDTAGQTLNRTYTKDADGKVVMADSVTRSIHNQVTTHANSATLNSQKYGYDKAGRLVEVQDTAANVCTDRLYTFDKRSNRTALGTTVGAAGAACTTTGGTSTGYAFDSADRLVNTGYVYDNLGRTTALPGGTTVGYYANDMAYQQTTGTQRQTWKLDANDRFRSWTTESNASGTWTQTGSKVNHYGCDCDSPRWVTEDTATGAVTRNVVDLTSGLAATTGRTGEVVLNLTNVHGDVNVQLPLDAGKTPTVLDSDEYGNPRSTGAAAARYGWLGSFQRSAENPSGLVLMGARLYNPGTGRFLQLDPLPDGSPNHYGYPADPVNMYDLDGRSWMHCIGAIFAAVAGTYFGWMKAWKLYKAVKAAGGVYRVASRIYNAWGYQRKLHEAMYMLGSIGAVLLGISDIRENC